MNERTTAMPMSRSRSTRSHSDTAIASATSASEAATSARLTSIDAHAAVVRPRDEPSQHPVGHARGLLGVVRDQHPRDPEPLAQLEQRPLDRVARLLVERGRRLVEQQHAGLERERPGEHHALLLPHGEPRGVALGERGVEARELEQPRPTSASLPASRAA